MPILNTKVVTCNSSNMNFQQEYYIWYCQAQPSLNPAKAELCSIFTFSSHPPIHQPTHPGKYKGSKRGIFIQNKSCQSTWKKFKTVFRHSPRPIKEQKRAKRVKKGKKWLRKEVNRKVLIEQNLQNKRWLSTLVDIKNSFQSKFSIKFCQVGRKKGAQKTPNKRQSKTLIRGKLEQKGIVSRYLKSQTTFQTQCQLLYFPFRANRILKDNNCHKKCKQKSSSQK